MSTQHLLQPFAAGPKEGAAFWSLGGRFTLKAPASETDGAYSLFEAVMTKMAEPPLHLHQAEDEAWEVLDGKLTFYVGERVLEGAPDTFVFAPRNVPHTFTVDVEPTRVLVLVSPGGGFERFVQEAGTPVAGSQGPVPPDPRALAEVAERFGIKLLGPPPGHKL